MSVESLCRSMDIEQAFGNANIHIKNGKFELALSEVNSVVSECSGDPVILIKSASLLKSIDLEARSQEILDMVIDCITPEYEKKLAVAVALRGLGRYEDSMNILDMLDDNDNVLRQKAKTALAMRDTDNALEYISEMRELNTNDRILLTEIQCARRDLRGAYETAEKLSKEVKGYDILVNLCSVLILMGRNKDAIKLGRSHLKEDKKNADSLALAAYIMRINGKTPAAANFAHAALKIDHTHIGALETMALCLIEKKKLLEAKMMAGVINENDPGNPAVVRILDACREAL